MSSSYSYTDLNADYADIAQSQQDDSVESPIPQARRHDFHRNRWWTKLSHASEVVRDLYQRNIGLLLVVASQMFASLMNLSVKKLNGIDTPVSAMEVIIVRMIITYICSVTYMLSTGVPDPFLGPKGVRLLLVFRGVSGFFGLFGIYFSLQFLSLSDATVLTFLSPLCTAAAGALFLGEEITRREALAGVLSLAGVVLIARPAFIFGVPNTEVPDISIEEDTIVTPEQRLIAVGVALIGVLGATGGFTSLRAIGKRAHPLHSLVSFSALCVIVGSIGMIVTKTPFVVPTKLDWLAVLVMIGIFGFASQVLLTMGLARETAGRGTMAIYSQVIFATVIERIFFHTVPAALSIVGALMIIASALYVAITKESSPGTEKDDRHTVRLQGGEEDSMECGLLRHNSEDSEHQEDPEHKSQDHRDEEEKHGQLNGDCSLKDVGDL